MRVKGQTAIITGAASGIGAGIALALSKEGANVVLVDLNACTKTIQSIHEENSEARILECLGDIRDPEFVKATRARAADTFGELHILVNNAGIMDGMEPVGEISDEKWDRVFSVNTTGVMRAMRIATNIFLEQGHGVIVNNISAGGLRGARAGAAYTASKHAVTGLTKNTAYMYAHPGIRCNGIAPGGVKTNISASMTSVSEFGAKRQGTGIPTMPRAGEPSEIAQLALFLASDEASFVNGQVIAADAGWTAY